MLKNQAVFHFPIFLQVLIFKGNGGTGRTRTADRDFADLGLTTWRRCPAIDITMQNWSGRRGSNPRLQPWQGCTLPLSYSRTHSDTQGCLEFPSNQLYFLNLDCQILFFSKLRFSSLDDTNYIFVMLLQSEQTNNACQIDIR